MGVAEPPSASPGAPDVSKRCRTQLPSSSREVTTTAESRSLTICLATCPGIAMLAEGGGGVGEQAAASTQSNRATIFRKSLDIRDEGNTPARFRHIRFHKSANNRRSALRKGAAIGIEVISSREIHSSPSPGKWPAPSWMCKVTL